MTNNIDHLTTSERTTMERSAEQSPAHRRIFADWLEEHGEEDAAGAQRRLASSEEEDLKKTENEWNPVALNDFEEEARPGRWVWACDALYGFARRMRVAETIEQAVADFERAGEPATKVRVYQDGEWVE